MKHRLRVKIDGEFLETAAIHIRNKDLSTYETDGTFIYNYLTEEEYRKRVGNGDNEPFIMEELGVEADYDFNYKG